MKILKTLRTEKTLKRYENFVKRDPLKGACGMCREKNIKEFKYWRIIKARFPLDQIARIDHLIMPKRHVPINKLAKQEKNEFEKIKKEYINENYVAILESTPKGQSIPSHHHIHLLIYRKD